MRANDQMVMELLACPVVPVDVRRVKLIAWKPLERWMVKLNVDGGSCGNPREAMGVLLFGILMVE